MVNTRKRDYEDMAQRKISRIRVEKKPSGLKTVQKSTDLGGSGVDRLTALPSDVTLSILQYLAQSDLCHCAQICRGLSAVAGDNQLWKGFWKGVVLTEPTLKTLYEQSQQSCDYKALCKRAAVTKAKWKTGQGVSTFTNENIRCRSDVQHAVISSSYILVTGVVFTPVIVFSSDTGEYLRGLTGLDFEAQSVIMSKDEHMVAAHYAHVVCVWNIDKGKCLYTFNHTGYVAGIAMQNEMLSSIDSGLSSIDSGDVYLWSLESGLLMHRFPVAYVHVNDRRCVLVMDHQLLAVYEKTSKVLHLWDAILGNQLMTRTCHDTEEYLEILVDSATHSLVGMEENAVCVWDTDTGTQRGIVQADGRHQYRRMLMQGAHLLIHSAFNHHAIIVVGLEGMPAVLYSIDGGPATVERPVCMRLGPQARKSAKLLSGYIMKVVSSELVVVTSQEDHCVYLFDVNARQFVRKMDEEGEGQGKIVGLNASFSRLQVMRKAVGSGTMSYVSYDFDAQ